MQMRATQNIYTLQPSFALKIVTSLSRLLRPLRPLRPRGQSGRNGKQPLSPGHTGTIRRSVTANMNLIGE